METSEMPITREIRDETRLNDPCRHDLGTLTAAEKLFVWRHRRKSTSGRFLGRNGPAMSQAEAAEHLGIGPGRYNNLENGLRTGLSAGDAERLIGALGPLAPTVGELCFLARRRSGHLLMTLERELGMSRPRFHELERAGDPAMVRFWAARGYRFPTVEEEWDRPPIRSLLSTE